MNEAIARRYSPIRLCVDSPFPAPGPVRLRPPAHLNAEQARIWHPRGSSRRRATRRKRGADAGRQTLENGVSSPCNLTDSNVI